MNIMEFEPPLYAIAHSDSVEGDDAGDLRPKEFCNYLVTTDGPEIVIAIFTTEHAALTFKNALPQESQLSILPFHSKKEIFELILAWSGSATQVALDPASPYNFSSVAFQLDKVVREASEWMSKNCG